MKANYAYVYPSKRGSFLTFEGQKTASARRVAYVQIVLKLKETLSSMKFYEF